MRLFVARVGWKHEGTEVIGIFDSEELAQTALANHKYKDGSLRGDFREIIEYSLNDDTWEPLI